MEDTLPEPAVHKDVPSVIPAAEDTKPLILLVEDSPPNIMVATSYLQTLGYRYKVAKNGREAMACYREQRFALILMDIHMPEMDGFDVTRAIREQEATGDYYTPSIALTSFATKHDREKCLRHGMDDYISKPFLIEELKTKMANFLEAGAAPSDKPPEPAGTTLKKAPIILTEPFSNEDE